jgi:ubiquinone/menaquinone biosynthesis C-methylase UbiE
MPEQPGSPKAAPQSPKAAPQSPKAAPQSPKAAPQSPKAAAKSPASPASPKSPAHVAEETTLQPGSHWVAQGMPEVDNDDADSALGTDAASSTASISSSILEYRTVNGRTYHSERGDSIYWGPNDDRGQECMDIQNHIWSLAFDDKLFLAPLSDDIEKAVDIGTGTGIWAIDFADARPNCQVVGTDLSPIQPSWIPPNLSFQIDDLNCDWTFEPNTFDYVHTRWLVGAVHNWDHMLQEAFKALKPGGWVECWDLDAAFLCDDGTLSPKSALSQWSLIFVQFNKTLDQPAEFFPVQSGVQLRAVENAGFANIHKKTVRFPVSPWPKDPKLKELGQYQQAAILGDLDGFMGYATSSLKWTKQEQDIYAAHMRKELRDTSLHAYIPGLAVWAQKPEC